MKKALAVIKKNWRKPVSIMFVPYGSLPQFRFKATLPFLLTIFVMWALVTVWAIFMAMQSADYYITKLDNYIMNVKLNFVAKELSESRRYLHIARETELQMKKAVGMSLSPQEQELLNNFVVEENTEDFSLRAMVNKKTKALSQHILKEQIEQVNQDSKKLLATYQEIAWYLANRSNIESSTPSIWPADGRVTSFFGYRLNPFGLRYKEEHMGVDIANKPDTPIYASADGTVRYAGWGKGYGQSILIDHGFGLSTLYGHTTQILVSEGQKVTRGQMIARMGTTGRSTGIHLHYEVWQYGKPVNPMQYLKVENRGSKRK